MKHKRVVIFFLRNTESSLCQGVLVKRDCGEWGGTLLGINGINLIWENYLCVHFSKISCVCVCKCAYVCLCDSVDKRLLVWGKETQFITQPKNHPIILLNTKLTLTQALLCWFFYIFNVGCVGGDWKRLENVRKVLCNKEIATIVLRGDGIKFHGKQRKWKNEKERKTPLAKAPNIRPFNLIYCSFYFLCFFLAVFFCS